MGTRYMNEYVPLQMKSTFTFLADLGETPANFMDHIKRWEFLGHDVAPRSDLIPVQILCDPISVEHLRPTDLYPQPLPQSWV